MKHLDILQERIDSLLLKVEELLAQAIVEMGEPCMTCGTGWNLLDGESCSKCGRSKERIEVKA